jgi:hypothetical protein
MKKRIKEKRKGLFATKERKLTIAFGAFFILIMVASVLNSYDKPDEENEYELNGIKFFNTENGWIAHKGDNTISILSNPKDLANLTIDIIPLGMLNNMEKIYVSTNPKDNNMNALYEFQKLPISARKVSACYEDNELCYNMPLKKCADASDKIGVILIKESNITEVSFESNCLTIQGRDLVKLMDKLIIQQV